jgi:hypothetical protein
MRDFKGMKRQRGRNRGQNTGGGGGQGGGKPQHNVNRAFDSTGPEGIKIRGNAQHVFEKYQQLARDAMSAGDRVLGENYTQHAEHYFRVLRAVQPLRPPSDFLGRETFTSGFDIDFEDESNNNFSDEAIPENETASEAEGEQPRSDQPRNTDQNRNNDQPRGDREWQNRGDRQDRNFNRDQRPRDNNQPRDDRPRDYQQRDSQQRDNQSRDGQPRDYQQRDDRPRDNQPREDRPRYNRENRYNDRPREGRDPLAVVEPESTPLTAAAPAPAPVPEAAAPQGRQLRSQDGSLSPAPAFLQARPERAEAVPAAAEEAKPARAPRRRRAPRAVEGEAPTASETEDA